jgi:hypothetical protein
MLAIDSGACELPAPRSCSSCGRRTWPWQGAGTLAQGALVTDDSPSPGRSRGASGPDGIARRAGCTSGLFRWKPRPP